MPWTISFALLTGLCACMLAFFLAWIPRMREGYSDRPNMECPMCGNRIVTAQVFADPDQLPSGLSWTL